MRLVKIAVFSGLLTLLTLPAVRAHCPLCTLGAAAAAGGAAYFGVSHLVIGLFIGAFAVSIGWWFSRLLKKKYFPFQHTVIILVSFLTTVIPLMPLLSRYSPLYFSWIGEYGTTFALDVFLNGSIIGGFIVMLTPWLSRRISAARNGKMVPYQGMILTFGLLVIVGVLLQVIV